MNLKNDNGLFINEDNGAALGYLFDFTGHGIYSPDGKVDGITKETADRHNQLLSQAEIAGLDKALIDQWGTLYYTQGKGVHTWIGAPVSAHVEVSPRGKSLTFYRNGKAYRGMLQEGGMFNFRRIQ